VADEQARAGIVAADLLAQAARDILAAAILITTDRDLAEQVQIIVTKQLAARSQSLLIEKAIAHHCLIVVVDKISQAVELTNQFAPAQVMLWVSEPWELASSFRHAGTILLGGHTPTAVNNYIAGPNSTMPTSGTASFSSGLGVENFMKYSNLIEYSSTSLSKLERAINALAQAEGMLADIDAVERRIED
jgi:histidinol dehydrogenase